EVALGAFFDRRVGRTCRAHVLNGNHFARFHEFEARFQQAFFGERIAHLHGRALFLDAVVELGGCHDGAANAVAPGLGAKVNYRQAYTLGLGVENGIRPGDAGGKGVDEDVAVVAGIEIDLASHGRHAEGIAVAAYAGDHARYQVSGLGMAWIAEAQGVHGRYRPRAHGEDVAQYATHAGSCALIWFDIGWMVVALHLEDHAVAVADIHHAGILSRALDHDIALGRQCP